MKRRDDPALALPGELLLAGPVAAQPDLHVAARVDVALPRPAGTSACRARPRPRRARIRCRCGRRSGSAQRARGRARRRARRARRSSGRRRARSGSLRPRRPRATVASIARCERSGSAGITGGVAVVDHPQHLRRRRSPASRCGRRHAAAGRADRPRPEARPRMRRWRARPSARRRSRRRPPASSAGVLPVGHPGERRQAGVVGPARVAPAGPWIDRGHDAQEVPSGAAPEAARWIAGGCQPLPSRIPRRGLAGLVEAPDQPEAAAVRGRGEPVLSLLGIRRRLRLDVDVERAVGVVGAGSERSLIR